MLIRSWIPRLLCIERDHQDDRGWPEDGAERSRLPWLSWTEAVDLTQNRPLEAVGNQWRYALVVVQAGDDDDLWRTLCWKINVFPLDLPLFLHCFRFGRNDILTDLLQQSTCVTPSFSHGNSVLSQITKRSLGKNFGDCWSSKRQVWLIPIADECLGVQVKLWDPLRTRAIPEWPLLRWCFTKRRYIKLHTFTFTFCSVNCCHSPY